MQFPDDWFVYVIIPLMVLLAMLDSIEKIK